MPSEPAVEVERDDLLLQDLVEVGGVGVIARRLVRILAPLAEGPAVGPVVAFLPPAVDDAGVGQPVQARLLPAGAAGLMGTDRVIEPDVAAADEMPRHVDVVVLQQHDLAGELRLARVLVDLADQFLRGRIVGMRLAGEDDLHRARWVAQDARKAVGIAEEQRRALIRREAAREAEGQRVGVERLCGGGDRRGTLAVTRTLPRKAIAGVFDEIRLQLDDAPPRARRRESPRSPARAWGRRDGRTSRGRGVAP